MTNVQAPMTNGLASSLIIGHWFLVIYSRVYPFRCPIRPILLLPDWHVLFDRVNEPLAGGEGVVAMGRADGDGDAGFAQLQAAQSMDDRAAGERPAAAGFRLELSQLFPGHF